MADQRELTAAIGLQHQGMDASVHASTLPATKFARGINIAIRGGHVRTRPGFHEFSSDIADSYTPDNGAFQGAGCWRTPDGDFIVTAFAGVVRRTSLATGATVEIGAHVTTAHRVYMCQAGPYFVVHASQTAFVALNWVDGTHVVVKTPLIPGTMYDDSWGNTRTVSIALAARIAEILEDDPLKPYAEASQLAYGELTEGDEYPKYPSGTVCCFAHGRIHLSSNDMDHRYFFSSDIMEISDQSSVLKWYEHTYLNEGGGLGLPDSMGEIRGMAVMQNSTDTASGIGPLIVIAQEGAAAFSVNLPREGVFDMSTSSTDGTVSATAKLLEPGWKDRQISQVLFYGGGTEAPWSLVRVNGDLLYRAHDGIRTIRSTFSSASSGATVANAPISAEVRPFMVRDDIPAQQRMSAASVDNRVLVTAGHGPGAEYNGLVSLDLCVSSSLETAGGGGGARQTGYDGMWTGLKTVMVLEAGGELVFIAEDGRMYKLSESRWDMRGGVRRDIECQWMTGALGFDAPGLKKRLNYVDLWVRDMTGDVSVDVYFRPDNFEYWTQMDGSQTFSVPEGGQPQERRRVRFRPKLASHGYHVHDGSLVTTGESFQFLVIWRGDAAMHRLIATAYAESDGPPRSSEECAFAAIEPADDQLVQNDFSYTGV
jgi:hypothetical protein